MRLIFIIFFILLNGLHAQESQITKDIVKNELFNIHGFNIYPKTEEERVQIKNHLIAIVEDTDKINNADSHFIKSQAIKTLSHFLDARADGALDSSIKKILDDYESKLTEIDLQEKLNYW